MFFVPLNDWLPEPVLLPPQAAASTTAARVMAVAITRVRTRTPEVTLSSSPFSLSAVRDRCPARSVGKMLSAPGCLVEPCTCKGPILDVPGLSTIGARGYAPGPDPELLHHR